MTESWWLKLQRADHHLKEVNKYLTAYERKHAYRARLVPNGQRKQDEWRYVLEITAPPNERLPVVIGDAVHNMRSALDHLLVAMRPRKYRYNKGFPVLVDDPWDGPPTKRKLADIASYEEAVHGLSDDAEALIKSMQPYQARAEGRDPLHNGLNVICRLDNRDKHREPIVVAPGLVDPVTFVVARGQVLKQQHPPTSSGYPGLVEDGTEVAHFMWNLTPPLTEGEVKVEVSGTPLVALDIGLKDGYMDARRTLAACLGFLWESIVPALEEHLPKRG